MKQQDKPFNWRIGRQSDISIDCPDCHRPARVTVAGVRTNAGVLKFEAICASCGKYVYVMVTATKYALGQRGKKCTLTARTTSSGAA